MLMEHFILLVMKFKQKNLRYLSLRFTISMFVLILLGNSLTFGLNAIPPCNSLSIESQTACGSYNWILNGQIYTVSGTYSYFAPIVTGCNDTVVLDLTILNLPVASTTSNSPVCSGDALNFAAGGGVSYSWTGPNGFISQNTDTILFPSDTSQNGTYYVTVIGSNGCSVIDSVLITVNR